MEKTAWLGLLNPLPTPQKVIIRLLTDKPPLVTETTVAGRTRNAVPLHAIYTGTFGLEVEWERWGVTSLVMWNKDFTIPHTAQIFVGCAGAVY